ncbi:MAG TPA: type II CAAX endopeptidase family protein [Rhodanobacteraceae bacterium]|nr:type II CAAX endopeptidase family protein [Rhodanobacteraceae bacterium]
MTESNPMAEVAPPPPRQPGIWSGLGTVLLYFVLQFGVSLIVGLLAGFAIAISYIIGAGMQHAKFDADAIKQLVQQPDIRISIVLATLVVTAVVMLWFIHRRWRPLWSVAQAPGFGFTRSRSLWWFVIAAVAGLVAAIPGGMLAQFLAGPHAPRQDISLWAHSVSLGLRIPLALATVCIVPIAEEAIFRGVLLSGLMRRMHVLLAVLLSALIFGAVHLPDFKFAWYPIPTLVLLGLLLAWLRVHSRSIWPSITAHATNNLVAAVTWFLVTHPHP